jgi:hypothetical protein
MNQKLFVTVFLAIFGAGACLYLFARWMEATEAKQLALPSSPRREIGFAAILKEQQDGPLVSA